MKKFNRFGYVYSLIRKRHRDWSDKKLISCTIYALSKK